MMRIHGLFLPVLQADLNRWIQAWNHHSMATGLGSRRQSPIQLWTLQPHENPSIGELDRYGIDWGQAASEVDCSHEGVEVPSTSPYVPSVIPETLLEAEAMFRAAVAV